MSLKVWLPLNGDLENRGISNTTKTSGTAVWQTYGKINSSALGLQNKIEFSTPSLNGLQFFSIAFWARIDNNSDSSSNWMDVIGFFDKNPSETATGRFRFETGYASDAYGGIHWHDNSECNIVDGSYTYNTSSERGKWHHIVVIVADEAIYSYYDGELKSTITANLNKGHLTGNWWIGESTTRGGIQDIRVYDHCLSAAEVKEISQGLVLHYKLDNKNNTEDLLADAQDLTTWSKESGITCTWDNTVGMYKVLDSSHTSSRWGIYKNITLKANTTYFFYITGMKVDQTANVGCAEGTGWPANFKSFGTVAEIASKTFTMGDADANCRIYLNLNPIEGGSNYAYYLSPHLITFTSNIIQDSSGYNNNAVSNGSIAIKDDVETIRYQYSTLFAAGARIAMPVGSKSCLPIDAITVNIWAKSSNLANRFLSCTESGGWNFEVYDSSYIRVPIYINGKGYTYCNTNVTWSSISDNQWHMLSFTYDKQIEKIYLDGELIQSSNSFYPGFEIGYNVNTPLTLGAEAQTIASPIAGTYVGNLSDLRIYATPLLDSDIKSLYNVGMKIDNLSNIHTFEFDEEDKDILAGIPWTSPYSTHSTTQNLFTNYNSDGEPQFTVNGTSAGSQYIEITPGVYYYDTTISVNTGNQFYIGFERYDADKTSRSNQACVYIYTTKPSSDVVKQRYNGTVDLSTDSVNPLKYITLRVLNGWSGTNSGVTGQATIHHLSLRLVSGAQNPKLEKTGQLITSELKEMGKSSLYQNRLVEAAEFIER